MIDVTGDGRTEAEDAAEAADVVDVADVADVTDVATRVWTLFVSTLTASLTANTGYVIVGTMRREICERRGWLDEGEMNAYVALASSAPGPIAVNAAVALGWRVAGAPGALSALAGCILPPFLAMLAVSLAYGSIAGNALAVAFLRGMRLGVVALLIDVLAHMSPRLWRQGVVWSFALAAASFLYVRYLSASVAWLVLACALAGVASALVVQHAGRNARR